MGGQPLVGLEPLEAGRGERDVLGVAEGAAGAVVVHGLLVGEELLSGELLALNMVAEILIGLHRHGPAVVGDGAYRPEGVVRAERGASIGGQDSFQQCPLGVLRGLCRGQEAPQAGLLADNQRGSEGDIAGIHRHQRWTLSNLGTKGVRICVQNPVG